MPGGIDGIGGGKGPMGPHPGTSGIDGPARAPASPGTRFAEVLDARRTAAPSPPSPPPIQQPVERTAASERADSGIPELLRQAGRSIARGERMVNRAIRAARAGKVFSQEELIALQAGVYRYTQELELAAKLVDKSTQAVKRTVESQR